MHIIKGNKIREVADSDEYDYALEQPESLQGTHINTIPVASAVQPVRWFYGARFVNQALAMKDGEAPLVQSLSKYKERSFDAAMGDKLGAVRSRKGGVVKSVDPHRMVIVDDDGNEEEHDLYNHMALNQKSGLHSRALKKVGDRVDPDQLVAVSNFLDDEGVPNMGKNALIALTPYRGQSMDDAVPVSESFAKRMTSEHYKTIYLDDDATTKFGLSHYRSQFPTRFKKEQFSNLDDDGIVRKGSIVKSGEPLALLTKPKAESGEAALGRLGKTFSQARTDAAKTWGEDQDAEVVDVRKTKRGRKITLRYEAPLKAGDKIVLRQGAKGTSSRIIPDDQMPRTADGKVIDVLLNPLSLPSRANAATFHEMRLGKIAKKIGKPISVPSFLPKGQTWDEFIEALEHKHGVEEAEQIFDPELDRFLEQPVSTGYGFIQKLHHVASSKESTRGVGSYDQNQMPSRNQGDKAKYLSGLETNAMLAAGAYDLLRDSVTIRGQKSDEFWQALRTGRETPKAGEPFVWKKFRKILAGSGIQVVDKGKGKLRLAPFTDKDLEDREPVDIENAELVDLSKNFAPITGGLFDPAITTGSRWGRIRLPEPMVNPAFEDAVVALLGITKKELEELS